MQYDEEVAPTQMEQAEWTRGTEPVGWPPLPSLGQADTARRTTGLSGLENDRAI
jgi:hypothetical protein